MMAIFGTPGLVTMFEMYDVLHEKMQTCKKPIFPILPSINTAGAEVAAFLAKGHVNFADEVTLGTALSRIVNVPKPAVPEIELFRGFVALSILFRRMVILLPITYKHYCMLPVFRW